jgi:IS30 family transposase
MARQLIIAQPRTVRTITLDNGTEFHSDKALEATIAARCYFATPLASRLTKCPDEDVRVGHQARALKRSP